MRLPQLLLAFACIGLGAARAAEPVTVELKPTASVGASVVTLADVAQITGGDALTRAKVARVDVAELKSRQPAVQLGRRSVEYRLILAGLPADAVRVTGAERSSISLAKRAVTVEEVMANVRAELARNLPGGAEANAVELALPVAVKLPEIPAYEQPVITAKPHGQVVASGRVQMDVTVCAGTEQLLAFAVHLNVSRAAPKGTTFAQVNTAAVVPAGGSPPPLQPQEMPAAAPAPGAPAFVIRPRQRVTMEVRSGALTVKALGEAMQEGRQGDTILVQNVDSKKSITARVTGPQTVEVDIGGSP